MAKQYIDAAITTEKDAMVNTSTSATLTNQVRVIYDDTLSTEDLHTLITRIRDKIGEVNS